MAALINEVGNKYGKLTVVQRVKRDKLNGALEFIASTACSLLEFTWWLIVLSLVPIAFVVELFA